MTFCASVPEAGGSFENGTCSDGNVEQSTTSITQWNVGKEHERSEVSYGGNGNDGQITSKHAHILFTNTTLYIDLYLSSHLLVSEIVYYL